MEDEIDLIDYVKVIWKRRILILAVFLLAVIISAIFSFVSPRVYEVEALLEIGGFAKEPIESPTALATGIEAGRYRFAIREALNIDQRDYPEIKAENPKDTNLLIIKTEETDINLAKRILEKHIELILEEHEQKAEEEFLILEARIEENQSSLDLLKAHKVYADQGIASLQNTVSSLKERLSLFKATEVIKQPLASDIPISPRPLLNVAIAGILGLFAGVFLAFGREWWQRA